MRPRKRVNQRLARAEKASEKISEARVKRMPAAKRFMRAGFIARLRNYFAMHFHMLTNSLSQLGRTPASNLMTAAVIGIALALPAALHVFLGKIQALGSSWQESAQISLFLKTNLSDQTVNGLTTELRTWAEISSVEYISPEQALDDFKQHSGLGDALSMLDQNPLPGVVVVYPASSHRGPAEAESLLEKLRQRTEVDLAQLDLEWVQRLQGLIAVANRAVTVLGGLLALAVLFVIGNTIRLSIQNRHDEIEVVKLIGGSDAFVRRPFLYNGIWHGLFGGLLAWLLVNVLLLMLNGPVQNLAELYGSDFSLGVVDIKTTLLLLLSGPVLGLMGAWLVAGRHLKAVEPA